MNPQITYTNYPLLLFSSYTKDTAPEELPFIAPNQRAHDYLKESTAFTDLFTLLAIKNQEFNHNNYLLSEEVYVNTDSNDAFRSKHFAAFQGDYPRSGSGLILLPRNGGQYVYVLLSEHETRTVRQRSGRLMIVAMLVGNMFVGCEECYLTAQGIELQAGGFYDAGMDPGGYISFVAVLLAYMKGKKPTLAEAPSVTEKIWNLV